PVTLCRAANVDAAAGREVADDAVVGTGTAAAIEARAARGVDIGVAGAVSREVAGRTSLPQVGGGGVADFVVADDRHPAIVIRRGENVDAHVFGKDPDDRSGAVGSGAASDAGAVGVLDDGSADDGAVLDDHVR